MIEAWDHWHTWGSQGVQILLRPCGGGGSTLSSHPLAGTPQYTFSNQLQHHLVLNQAVRYADQLMVAPLSASFFPFVLKPNEVSSQLHLIILKKEKKEVGGRTAISMST